MSDPIKHECGIALLRLKKPLEYFEEKYGSALHGINKLYLLMEKQHNRGQDGAGVANIKLDVDPGKRYISRKRSISQKPIQDVFDHINSRFKNLELNSPEKLKDCEYLRENLAFTGELFLGHLRYGTYGKNSIESCHPFLRLNNWRTKNLVVAGNFNLTNVDELFNILVEIGQHPKEKSDTVTVLEKIGHFLDEENEELFQRCKKEGHSYQEISEIISRELDIQRILKRSAVDWDGGYAMAGLVGHGDAFVLRDPNGIRPAFWYEDEEIVVVTSERPAIQTAFNLQWEQINELTPGHALIIKKDGSVSEKEVRKPMNKKACSFERIYFSRGSDKDIYKERMMLGNLVCDAALKEVNYDLENTVFSFIPNTAETAFYGMIKRAEDQLNEIKSNKIMELGRDPSKEEIESVLNMRARIDKLLIKDAKLRTFIAQDEGRDDMVAHVYDITYGTVVRGKDNVIVIDDSIVRGTTLKQSVVRILDRLGPKNIVIASSAPQIRYPDCYGIDMAKMGDFIAFQAAVELLRERNLDFVLDETYDLCKVQENLPKEEIVNHVKKVYERFSDEEISDKISELLTPANLKSKLKIIYLSVEDLHKACPGHTGDWYFTGDYPTPGGNKVVNKAFINYMEGKNVRAY